MPGARVSATLILFDFIFTLNIIPLDLREVKATPERILRPPSGVFPPLSPTLCSPGSKLVSCFHSVPLVRRNHRMFARPWIQASWNELMSSHVAPASRICNGKEMGKNGPRSNNHGPTGFCVLHLELAVMVFIFPSLEAYHISLPTIFFSVLADSF